MVIYPLKSPFIVDLPIKHGDFPVRYVDDVTTSTFAQRVTLAAGLARWHAGPLPPLEMQ